MWSDSCASQFRYPFAFELLENHHKDVIINWHYNEGHHGNSPMDGIGDTIKIWCSGALKSGKVMINSPKEFCDAANQFASSISTLFQKEKLFNLFFFQMGKNHVLCKNIWQLKNVVILKEILNLWKCFVLIVYQDTWRK